jgi:hypothetical protein
MKHVFLTKKEKKKLQNKKNRHQQELYNIVRLQRLDEDRVEALEEDRKPKRNREGKQKKEDGDDKVWSEKMVTIRNRLTNKKRDSKERWNRFAGTSDAGSRGL